MNRSQFRNMHEEAKRLQAYHKVPACIACGTCLAFHSWLTRCSEGIAFYKCAVDDCGAVTKQSMDMAPERTIAVTNALASVI